MIALLGGGVGLFLTYLGIRGVRAGLNFNDAISDVPVSLDTNVLLFAAVVSLVSAILSSVAPALKASRTDINTDLKSEGRGATSGRAHNRLRVFLVGGEIALALFLLIGSCLLIRGVYLLDHQKLGFNHDHLLTAGLVLDQARYADSAKQIQFVREPGGANCDRFREWSRRQSHPIFRPLDRAAFLPRQGTTGITSNEQITHSLMWW